MKQKKTISIFYNEILKNDKEKFILEFKNGDKILTVLDTVYISDNGLEIEDDNFEEFNVILLEVLDIIKDISKTFKKGMLYEVYYSQFPVRICNLSGKIIYSENLIK